MNERETKIIRYVDSIKNGWRKFPPSLHIELTDHCFNKCIMCGHWKRTFKTSIDGKVLIGFLKKGKQLGLESICLSGGDPMINQDLNKIMEWCFNNEIDFGIVTAGFVPNNIDFSFLRKAKWVRVSLDALGNAAYKKCRGGSISFDEVHKSVQDMNSYGVNVQFGITIHKHNVDDLEAIYLYASKHGSRTDSRLVYDHAGNLSIDNDQIDGVIRLSQKYMANFDHYSPTHIETCYACLYQLFIRADGEIFPCCIMAGDTEEKSKAEVSFGSIYSNAWGDIHSWANHFADHRSDAIKAICDESCIMRLDTINGTVHSKTNERNFF